MRRRVGVDGPIVQVRPSGVTAQPFEQPHVVHAVGAGVRGARTKWRRDRQVGIDAGDVLDRGVLEVEHGGVLTEIGDLDDGAGAAVLDQERLVALATEVARLPLHAEDLGRNACDFFRRKARRLCLEDGRQGSSITGQPRRYAALWAPVAQWIEQRFPKSRALVRFRPGAFPGGLFRSGLAAISGQARDGEIGVRLPAVYQV